MQLRQFKTTEKQRNQVQAWRRAKIAELGVDEMRRRGRENRKKVLAKKRAALGEEGFRLWKRADEKVGLVSGERYKAHLCFRARRRGRDRGFEASITRADLVWPTHCPVFGTPLDYDTPCGLRDFVVIAPENQPSLDRLDNSKGYVKGNVFVISLKANTLKNAATLAEVRALLAYLEFIGAP